MIEFREIETCGVEDGREEDDGKPDGEGDDGAVVARGGRHRGGPEKKDS